MLMGFFVLLKLVKVPGFFAQGIGVVMNPLNAP